MARIHETLSGQRVEYPDPDAAVAKFLRRVSDAVENPKVTEGELIGLVYGRENPILDHTLFPERGAVTREVLDNPVYQVLTDLLARKTLAVSKTPPERVAARYKLSVAEAAERKGVSEDAIRKAIRARRVPAWLKGGAYFLDPKSLDAVDIGARATPSAHPLEIKLGSDAVAKVSLRVNAPGIEPKLLSQTSVGATSSTTTLSRWRRVGVLTGGHDRLRFFVLEPGDKEEELRFHDYFVRGRFRVAAKENNSARAREAWETFQSE